VEVSTIVEVGERECAGERRREVQRLGNVGLPELEQQQLGPQPEHILGPERQRHRLRLPPEVVEHLG
jgi:hypothetical protein